MLPLCTCFQYPALLTNEVELLPNCGRHLYRMLSWTNQKWRSRNIQLPLDSGLSLHHSVIGAFSLCLCGPWPYRTLIDAFFPHRACLLHVYRGHVVFKASLAKLCISPQQPLFTFILTFQSEITLPINVPCGVMFCAT